MGNILFDTLLVIGSGSVPPTPTSNDYFYIEAAEDDSTLSFDNWNASYNLSSSFDRISWTALTSNVIATGVNTGTKVYLVGDTTTLGTTDNPGCRPTSDKSYYIGGKVLSLYNRWISPIIFENTHDLSNWQNGKTLLKKCAVDFGLLDNTSQMFRNCTGLSNLTDDFNCSNSTNTSYMFAGCSALNTYPSGFNCDNSSDMSFMFSNSKVSSLPDTFSCPNATTTKGMFYNCTVFYLIPSGLSAPNSLDTSYMFANANFFYHIPEGFRCPKTTNANHMFYFCTKLTETPVNLNCPALADASYMFYGCSMLKTISDGFSLPNITNAYNMFDSNVFITAIGNNVQIANGPNATATDDTGLYKRGVYRIGDNFEWFTNATFSGTWDPSRGIKNVFPNATSVGSGWKVYDHYDGE